MKKLAMCLVLSAAVLLADDLDQKLADAKEQLAARSYADAVLLLGELVQSPERSEALQEARYLYLSALALDGQHAEVVAVGPQIIGLLEGSPWESRAAYRLAESSFGLRRFADGVAILKERLERIAGADDRSRLAGVYELIADEAFEGYLVGTTGDALAEASRVPDYSRAARFYAKARSIYPAPNARCAFLQARATQELGQARGALEQFEAFADGFPEDSRLPEAVARAGELAVQLGRYADARRLLRTVADSSAWHPHALEQVGHAWRGEGKLDRAIAVWQQLLATHPQADNAERVHYALGGLCFTSGRQQQAQEFWQVALERFPEAESAAGARFQLAQSHLAIEQFPQAATALRAFLGAHPNDARWVQAQSLLARIPILLGDAAFANDDFNAAIEAWQSFLLASPVDAEAPRIELRIAEALRQSEQKEAARERWRSVVSKYPRSRPGAAAQKQLALSYQEEAALPELVAELRRLLDLFGGFNEARWARQLLAELQLEQLSLFSSRVYASDESLRVEVSARNLSELRYKLYPLDLLEYFRKKGHWHGVDRLAIDVIEPSRTWTAAVPSYEDYRLHSFELAVQVDAPGTYLLQVEGGSFKARCLLVQSDLDLVVKLAPEQILAFCRNRQTGAAEAGVEVLLADAAGRAIEGDFATGADGVLLRELPELGSELFCLAVKDGQLAFVQTGTLQLQGFGYSSQAHISTDRPIYRPGQTVRCKALLREVRAGAYTTPESAEVLLRVEDARGVRIHQQSLRADAFGAVASELVLDDEAALGSYRVVVELAGVTFSGSFAVEAYRKPEFTVSVLSAPTARPGDSLEFVLEARYLFGGAVADAAVEWQLWLEPYSFDGSRYRELIWFEEDLERTRDYGSQRLLRGSGRTDADGRLRVQVASQDRESDAAYVLRTSVQDASRQFAAGSGQTLVCGQAYFAVLRGERDVLQPGDRARLYLATVDAAHRPVSAEGTLELVRLLGRDEKVVGSFPAATDAAGQAVLEVVLREPGDYWLRYLSKDRGITDAIRVTVAGSQDRERARLLAERQVYREGEVARLLLESPVASGAALLTWEAERILGYRVFELSGHSQTLELSMDGSLAPNAWVEVAIPDVGVLYQAGDEIYLIRELDITLEADAEHYLPGDTAEISLTVRDAQGRPTRAQLSLALVDEAIFALRPDSAPDMRAHFFGRKRPRDVVTAGFQGWSFRGTTLTLSADALQEMEKKLKDLVERQEQSLRESGSSSEGSDDFFADNPAGAERREADRAPSAAESPAPEPESEPSPEQNAHGGRWRENTGEADDGEAGEAAYLRKRFVDTAYWAPQLETGDDGRLTVRIPLPDNLTTWRATLRGANAGDLFGQARAALEMRQPVIVRLGLPRFLVEGDNLSVAALLHNQTDAALDGSLTMSEGLLELEGGLRVAQKLPAHSVSRIELPGHARAAGQAVLEAQLSTPGGGDALQTQLPIVARGVPVRGGRTLLVADAAQWSFALPATMLEGSARLQLQLLPRGSDRLLAAAAQLETFPYACVEQTVHRFLPSLAVLETLEKLGSPDHDARQRLQEIIESSVAKLVAVQRPDGGFGWWRECPFDATMTAFGLLGLQAAHSRGVYVDPSALRRARQRSARALGEATPDQAALLLYALSQGPDFEGEWVNRVYRQVSSMQPAGLSLLLLALHAQQRPEYVDGLVGMLLRRGQRAEGMLHWSGGGGFSAVEASGYALRALAASQVRQELLDESVAWLETSAVYRGCWPSTRDSAAAIQGLCAQLQAEEAGARFSSLRVKIDGHDFQVDGDGLVEQLSWLNRNLRELSKGLRPGTHTVELATQGGTGLAVSLSLLHLLRPEDAEAGPDGLRVERSYQAYETAGGHSILRPESRPELPNLAALASGQKLWVVLDIETPEDLRYLEISDPIPAGCEILADAARGFERMEARDARAVFFRSSLPKGRHQIRYLLRALIPGQFLALPATLSPMYQPALLARSALATLRIHADVAELPAPPDQPDARYARVEAAREAGDARTVLDQSAALLELDLLPEVRLRLLDWRLQAVRSVGSAAELVAAFEALTGVSPQRAEQADLDLLLDLATAYYETAEHESALSFYRRLFEGYRQVDLELAQVYREIGRQEDAQQRWREVLFRFPDSNATQSSWFDWARSYLELVQPDAETPLVGEKPRRVPEALAALTDFVALFPSSPLCPQAQLLRAKALGTLKRPREAADEALKLDIRYPQSSQRVPALGLATQALFGARDYDQALQVGHRLLAIEAESDSHQAPVHYIFAQIHHIRGALDEAVEAYRLAAGRFVDAEDALAFLTERGLSLSQLVAVGPGSEPRLELRWKNLEQLDWRVYRVDLPMLLTEELELANLDLELTGIPPHKSDSVPLVPRQPYIWQAGALQLPLQDKGVYLVKAGSQGVERSAVVLISDLELEVQQTSGRTRVYVTSRSTGQPVAGVSLRISDGSRIAARGETDRRGIFETTARCRAVVAEKGADFALWR